MVDINYLDERHRILINHYGFFLQQSRRTYKSKARWVTIGQFKTVEDAIKEWLTI